MLDSSGSICGNPDPFNVGLNIENLFNWSHTPSELITFIFLFTLVRFVRQLRQHRNVHRRTDQQSGYRRPTHASRLHNLRQQPYSNLQPQHVRPNKTSHLNRVSSYFTVLQVLWQGVDYREHTGGSVFEREHQHSCGTSTRCVWRKQLSTQSFLSYSPSVRQLPIMSYDRTTRNEHTCHIPAHAVPRYEMLFLCQRCRVTLMKSHWASVALFYLCVSCL